MITFWKQTDGSFQQIQSIEENCLIKVVTPDKDEFDFLVNELKLDIDLIHDILDIDEVARIDKENGTTAIIMRIPLFTPTEEIPFRTIPLGIILHQSYLLTICLHDSAILDDILTNRIRNVSMTNFTDYILNIFNRSAYYLLWKNHSYISQLHCRGINTFSINSRVLHNFTWILMRPISLRKYKTILSKHSKWETYTATF